MAADEAKVKFTADDREVGDAWRKQFEWLAKLEKKIDAATNAAKKAGEGGLKSFTDWLNAGGVAKKAWDLVVGSMMESNEAMRRFREESSKLTVANDVVWRKLYNMAGVNKNDAGQRKLREEVYRVAEGAGIDPKVVARAATELFSQGMSMEQLVDEHALSTFAFGLVSLNLADTTDPEGIIQGLARAISNTGQSVDDARAWENLFGMLQQFQDTPLALPDLQRFASEMGVLTNLAGIDPATQIATFSSLLTQFDPGVASTQYRNFVMALKDAGKRPASLKAFGLKPEDVDFIGEDQQAIIDRLAAGYEALAAKDKAAADKALIEIFKKEGAAGAEHLIRRRDAIRESRARVADPKQAYNQFVANAGAALQGDAVAVRQAEIREQKIKDQPGAGLYESIKKDLYTKAIELGYSPREAEAFQNRYDVYIGEGFEPVEALEESSRGMFAITEPGQLLPGSDTWRVNPGPWGSNQALVDEVKRSNQELIQEVRRLRVIEETKTVDVANVLAQQMLRMTNGVKVPPP